MADANHNWLLYEHDDGRHAVAPTAESATFSKGDPAWHRVGPVEVPATDARKPLPVELARRLGVSIQAAVNIEEAAKRCVLRQRIGKLRAALMAADTDEAHTALEADDVANAGVPCDGCPTEDECRKLGCGVRFGQIVPDEVRASLVADAVLAEVVKWALAGHITEAGVTVEAGQAIRAAASGVEGRKP